MEILYSPFATPYALFSLLLARGIARVARGLALRLKRSFPGSGFFLFARELCGGLCRGFSLTSLLLGLGCFACQSGFGALGGQRLAFGLSLHDRRIVGPRFGAKLIEDVLLGFLRRLLPVCEARFLESTH